MIMIEFNPFTKIKPIRSKKYREYAVTRGCIICGAPAVFHHENFGSSAMGGKSSDIQGVPLCPYHHTTGAGCRHDKTLSWDKFYEHHNVNPYLEVFKLLNYFLSNGGKF